MIPSDVDSLEGRWIRVDGRVIADEACAMIEQAISSFVELGIRDEGWTRLFRDPDDGRLWEVTYPHSEMHGGGPPSMVHLTREEAERRYGHAV